MRVSSVILAAVCVALAFAADDATTTKDVTTEKSTTAAPDTTTPASTTPSSSTTEASSTTAAPTTSTPAPSSSTPAPTSSTPAPTSSTPAPTSSTPAPTSTTHKPAPKQQWVVKNKDGKVCMLMDADITIMVNSTKYEVPKDASSAESNCDEKSVHFMLEWNNKEGAALKTQLIMSVSNSEYYISNITVDLPNVTAEKDDLQQFKVAKGQYYKCKPSSSVEIEKDVNMQFSEMKYEVFPEGTDKEEFSGDFLECASEEHSNVVVVAVGCALGVLVIVILVTYLIARRRNRQRGYQSV